MKKKLTIKCKHFPTNIFLIYEFCHSLADKIPTKDIEEKHIKNFARWSMQNEVRT